MDKLFDAALKLVEGVVSNMFLHLCAFLWHFDLVHTTFVIACRGFNFCDLFTSLRNSSETLDEYDHHYGRSSSLPKSRISAARKEHDKYICLLTSVKTKHDGKLQHVLFNSLKNAVSTARVQQRQLFFVTD